MTIETAGDTAGAADHGRALAIVTERLAADFPGRTDEVGAVVAEAYARTMGARVQSFRVLLAERDARAVLRRNREHRRHPLRATA